MMKRRSVKIAIFAALILALASPAFAARGVAVQPMVRIKDLVTIEGIRDNQLVGMGVVVGLNGTGDRGQMVSQMMSNMSNQFGVTVDPRNMRTRNAAVVTVTCQLSPFLAPGQNTDVVVSTIGDAKSLEGGVLLQTPLRAANGQVYAVAQGPLTIGGWSESGNAATAKKNSVTVGRIPNGAIVEQGVAMNFAGDGTLSLLLNNSDFTTAQRVASAINTKFGSVAHASDARRIDVQLPASYAGSPGAFIASIEGLTIRPDTVARVVLNERTGTVVMGGNVRIGNVSVAHGSLTVRVSEGANVSQPGAMSGGQTVSTARTDIQTDEATAELVELPTTATVEDLTRAMNRVGATPRDLMAVLQAMDQAGALHGELVIQ